MLSSDIIARVEAREREAREARETQYILHTGVWKTRWIKSNSWTCCKSKDEDSTKCGETFEECIIARVEAAGKKRTQNYGNGDVYYGQMSTYTWERRKRHGYGTYTYVDGGKYVGEWYNHEKDGNGTCTYANGDKYVGEWKNGERDGNGTCTYANGGKYVGEYKNNKKHGQGTKTLADGTISHSGEWVNGNPKE